MIPLSLVSPVCRQFPRFPRSNRSPGVAGPPCDRALPRGVKLKTILSLSPALMIDIILFHLASCPLVSIRARTYPLPLPFSPSTREGKYFVAVARTLNHLNILMEKAPVGRFYRRVHNSLVRFEIYISSGNASRAPRAAFAITRRKRKLVPDRGIIRIACRDRVDNSAMRSTRDEICRVDGGKAVKNRF